MNIQKDIYYLKKKIYELEFLNENIIKVDDNMKIMEIRKEKVRKRDKLMEQQVRELTEKLYEANKTIVELNDTIEAYENVIQESKLLQSEYLDRIMELEALVDRMEQELLNIQEENNELNDVIMALRKIIDEDMEDELHGN